MKIRLKADKNIAFLDGSGTINANDVMRQVLEVEPESGVIARGERLWVVYQCSQDIYTGEILINEETGVFRSMIPQEILRLPGEWNLQLFVRLYSRVDDKRYITQYASNVKSFTVQSGLTLEDGMPVTGETVDAMYKNAENAVKNAQSAAEEAKGLVEQAQTSVTNITNIINNAKVGFEYDEENEELTLKVLTETDSTEA